MNTKITFNAAELASDVRKRRNRLSDPISLRDAALQVGVSSATLSRVENAGTPDVDTYAKVCAWLDIDMQHYFTKEKVEPTV
jgi:transcriptional regulator with XRE-family HTH domain